VIWHVIGWYLFIALLFGVFIWSMDTRKRTKEKRPKTDTAFERRLQAVMMAVSTRRHETQCVRRGRRSS
jgi:hypothetical protein